MKNKTAAIFFSATQKKRSNDTEYPYRQESDFYYLTGFKEDNAVLVLVKKKKQTKEILFVQKKDKNLELWNGKRLGVALAKKRFDVDGVESSKGFHTRKFLAKMKVEKCLHVKEISQKMRAIKTDIEIELIKKAISITKEAHHKAMAMPKIALYEYELQAEFEYEFKKRGAYSDAYTTIIAGGDNANTLHYINNSDILKDGELILIDAGCEYEMYASDITRTIPVNGKFSEAQKEIYELVLKTEIQVIEAIKEGVLRSDLQMMARESLCKGMVELKILNGDPQELLKEEKDRVYFPHGIGHWMGIDVHDPCPYKTKKGKEIALSAGMVLTIEPGLYFPFDDENIPQKYRGIGVRIEDNILVTKEGYENLSLGIVKSVEDIESIYSLT